MTKIIPGTSGLSIWLILFLFGGGLCSADPTSLTLRVKPNGTYLFVDTTRPPELGGPDKKSPPTYIYLSYLCVGPGDFIGLQRVGAFKAGEGEKADGSGTFQDDNTSMVAVFYGNGTLLSPGSIVNPVITLPTFPRNFPTDIPQDFEVSSNLTLVQVPLGASAILFSPNDSFFSDNTDPNGDYAVIVTTFKECSQSIYLPLIMRSTVP